MPRTGSDPDTGQPFPDISGTFVDENNWLRSWSHELYLWYDEIADLNPALFSTPNYFEQLKTDAVTSSGNPKDQFHFTMPTDEWRLLALAGASAGFGVQWAFVADTPPRELIAAFVEDGSPAAQAGIARGARVLAIDGVDLVNGNTTAEVAALNAGISPAASGETHTFTITNAGGSMQRTVSMTSAIVASDPVPTTTWFDTPTGRIGYLLFNSHTAPAEAGLIEAVETLASAGPANDGIDDLVLDLRYNGGGFLAIASQLAYMIAGQTATAGRTFELQQFNDQHPTTNPVTGEPLLPFPFLDQTVGFSAPVTGQPLPVLNLNRVYVLTGSGTCSASESIISSLQGIGVEVLQIGSTTCGKPYGFYPTDNCGTTYFTIQFQGLNDAGFGDYADGFSPQNAFAPASTTIPGCAVADDFANALGDPAESRLAAALQLRDFATCPAPSALGPGTSLKPTAGIAGGDVQLVREPALEMRWASPGAF